MESFALPNELMKLNMLKLMPACLKVYRSYFVISGVHGLRVQRCFSFSDTNNTVALLDESGCPIRRIMSHFRYDLAKGTAEATIYSMFKFPDSHRVHIQCDILVCPGTSFRRVSKLAESCKENAGIGYEFQGFENEFRLFYKDFPD